MRFGGPADLFIKIPGTPKGLSAIEDAIFAGIPVNVTLLFSRDQYLEAASAYMRGIERRIKAGLNPAVHSVASIFISRWDKAIAGKERRCLRRSRELAQWCSVEVTRFGNRIGNGNGGRASSTPKACGVISYRPHRRRAPRQVWRPGWRRGGRWPYRVWASRSSLWRRYRK